MFLNIMITIFIKYSCHKSYVSFLRYEEITNPISSRKYLSISNINDPTIPYLGGNSKLDWILNAEDAIFTLQKSGIYW